MQIASISSIIYPLALLGCPVGMGAMMWMMMKGPGRGQGEARRLSDGSAGPASVEPLREEHRRLGEAIEWLENEGDADVSQRR